jgi:hypothetical protein
MPDYILLAHSDATLDGLSLSSWDNYISSLRKAGAFEGGSSIGNGACFRKYGALPAVQSSLVGFIRVRAADLNAAAQLLAGNPAYESGATVEIRELPIDE